MIRPFQPGDHAAIAEIFTRSVHEIGCEVYSEEQCLAWSDREPNPAHWKRRCELKRPFVFLVDTEIAGFLELDPDGHIDCAYVHPKFQRRGIASALVRHAIETCFVSGLGRVYVEASLCAKPMFERLGFKVLEEMIVNIRGIGLVNYRMELTLKFERGSVSQEKSMEAGGATPRLESWLTKISADQ